MSLPRRLTSVLLSAALAVGAALGPGTAQAAPATHRDPGNGPDRHEVAAPGPTSRTVPVAGENQPGTPGGRSLSGPAPTLGDPGVQQGYPRQTRLREYPEDPGDRAVKLGLLPYHEIAPRLNDLQRESDRVSVEVVGESTQGRDLYLVTVTAPERPAETRRQDAWRDLIQDNPDLAARRGALRAQYKAPVWINANIHGDEWEGTDGAMRVIERLATSNDEDVRTLLEETRVHVTISNNPDGRVAGTRSNAAGFDVNRDHITSSQPESRAARDVLIATQPVLMLDQHGYTGDTLIEPGTPPHGQNYEFDLYIRHAYANALGMERAVQDLGHPETRQVDIPFRDYQPGAWDAWPPIFTPMYAIYHGAVGHTVEVPMRVNRTQYDTLPVEELRRRAGINTDVAEATIDAALDYVVEHRESLVADQIELFRRGWAGEAQRDVEDDYVPGFGDEDRYHTTFPRAYVIPAGPGQRSEAAAARLVDHLVAHDVRVERAEAGFRLGGASYPAGSYLVDMHQPKRGLANVMLEAGRDISTDVPTMYDISGWSHGLLWGASVDVVPDEAPAVATSPVAAAGPTGAVDAPPGSDLALDVVDGGDVRAVNALLAGGQAVHRLDDGSVVLPASARSEARTVADRYGVRFTASAHGERGVPLHRPVVAAAASADESLVLRDLGFEVRSVSTAVLDDGFDWSDVDVLYVSSGLRYSALSVAARSALDDFLEVGGVVTRGGTGATFNAEADLLTVSAVAGPSNANGVVAVSGGSGPVGTHAPDHSFVYSPLWFTELGPEVRVEQRYEEDGPLVAGHWSAGDRGPGAAAGAASVVSGVAERGARTVLFGTEPLFRAHPKGLHAQVGNAVFWAVSA
ncbi:MULTISPECIES: M14 family zinc carboxypeptidase [Actinoalloteichus]|uniref:M14 family zinc carboxypeptidase n=1 Tax=Actinoalloteichus TaxID=65496 RepID=UPI0004AB6106|nr:M14 family zinc carboxypeptidase [Actinoalloteichus caeruleus]